jgi:hypothetical protein
VGFVFVMCAPRCTFRHRGICGLIMFRRHLERAGIKAASNLDIFCDKLALLRLLPDHSQYLLCDLKYNLRKFVRQKQNTIPLSIQPKLKHI